MKSRTLCGAMLACTFRLAAGGVLEHPSPSTTLVRFDQLDSGVYKGSKPKTEADFEFLRSKNVKTILNLRFLPYLDGTEKHNAQAHGIVYLTGTMNASTFQPSHKHVDQILKVLHDPCNQPVYFHCDIGRDRTSLVSALYLLYFKGLPPEEGWQKMKQFGFKDSWTLMGLKHYLLDHETVPATLAAQSQVCQAAR